MDAARFHRPALPGDGAFEDLPGGDDPALRAESGARVAALLVRGARDVADADVVERVVRLADEEGLDELAQLWATAPADSLAGALWRLYLLRTWVHRNPVRASREFSRGRVSAPVHEVVAGVVDPPGPAEVRLLTDTVLRGVVTADLAVDLGAAELRAGWRDARRVAALRPTALLLPYALLGPVALLAGRLVLP